METGAIWLNRQLKGYGYSDKRLQARMEKVIGELSVSDMGKGFPAIFGNKHALKAFYSLMNHRQTTHTGLFACYRQNLQVQAGERYWVVQDTTSLNFTGQRQKAGMGYLSELSQRGLWLHLCPYHGPGSRCAGSDAQGVGRKAAFPHPGPP